MMEKNAKIYVAGHRGMVGSAIIRELQRQGYTNIITRTHAELDLTRQADVEAFFAADGGIGTVEYAVNTVEFQQEFTDKFAVFFGAGT